VPIDKLVPTLEEATTLTKLVIQSAAGRRLTSYVQWVTGPRRSDELDGPRELHIILIDNGRSSVLGQPLGEALYCIRCAACLNACPVYQRVGGHTYDSVYSGPIGIPFTAIVFGESDHTHELSRASSLCGACTDVCPVGIDIPRLILETRRMAVASERVRGLARIGFLLYLFVITHPWLYRLMTRLGRIASVVLAPRGRMVALPGLGRWTKTRDLPGFARQSFRQRFYKRRSGHAS